jgi:hypothetical protein
VAADVKFAALSAFVGLVAHLVDLAEEAVPRPPARIFIKQTHLVAAPVTILVVKLVLLIPVKLTCIERDPDLSPTLLE